MFLTSSQKHSWIYGSQNDLDELRHCANRKYIDRFAPILGEASTSINEAHFLKPQEELDFCRIVTDAGIRFSDDFKPDMWPSVRWTAFAYFKRFYLNESILEYSPKNVMIACYYLAAKVDEFNISIDNFVDNLSNGTKESNIEMVLTLEPDIMLKLDYNLTIHAPFRPFEGHLIEMKAIMASEIASINFDLEAIRQSSNEFLRHCLFGDAIMLFSPSQIALAAVKYGLRKIIGESKSNELIRDFLSKLFAVDFGGTGDKNTEEILKLEKLQIRIDKITEKVIQQSSQKLNQEESAKLQKKYMACIQKLSGLLPQLKQFEKEQTAGGVGTGNEFDSDDEF